jgi:hypothetical protein
VQRQVGAVLAGNTDDKCFFTHRGVIRHLFNNDLAAIYLRFILDESSLKKLLLNILRLKLFFRHYCNKNASDSSLYMRLIKQALDSTCVRILLDLGDYNRGVRAKKDKL